MDACEECGVLFDPDANLAAGEPFEFWCSSQCQRAWNLRQVDRAEEVDMASVRERARQRAPFAYRFALWQLVD